MGEHLADVVLKLSSVLHWLGKYEECNALVLLSRLLRANEVETLMDLEALVMKTEAASGHNKSADDFGLAAQVEHFKAGQDRFAEAYDRQRAALQTWLDRYARERPATHNAKGRDTVLAAACAALGVTPSPCASISTGAPDADARSVAGSTPLADRGPVSAATSAERGRAFIGEPGARQAVPAPGPKSDPETCSHDAVRSHEETCADCGISMVENEDGDHVPARKAVVPERCDWTRDEPAGLKRCRRKPHTRGVHDFRDPPDEPSPLDEVLERECNICGGPITNGADDDMPGACGPCWNKAHASKIDKVSGPDGVLPKRSKEWWVAKAKLEGGASVEAGLGTCAHGVTLASPCMSCINYGNDPRREAVASGPDVFDHIERTHRETIARGEVPIGWEYVVEALTAGGWFVRPPSTTPSSGMSDEERVQRIVFPHDEYEPDNGTPIVKTLLALVADVRREERLATVEACAKAVEVVAFDLDALTVTHRYENEAGVRAAVAAAARCASTSEEDRSCEKSTSASGSTGASTEGASGLGATSISAEPSARKAGAGRPDLYGGRNNVWQVTGCSWGYVARGPIRDTREEAERDAPSPARKPSPAEESAARQLGAKHECMMHGVYSVFVPECPRCPKAEPLVCTCRGDLRGWNHLPTCPKYKGDVDDALAASTEIGDCGFTERESAIRAFRQICELVEHDSPVYLLAAEEWASLAHEQRLAAKALGTAATDEERVREWRVSVGTMPTNKQVADLLTDVRADTHSAGYLLGCKDTRGEGGNR